METHEENNQKLQKQAEENDSAAHPPTEHNPYPYPIQTTGARKGWLRALFALIIVAILVTLFCLVVGIYEHHEQDLNENTPVGTVSITD